MEACVAPGESTSFRGGRITGTPDPPLLCPPPPREHYTDIPRDGYTISPGNSSTTVGRGIGTIRAKAEASAAAKNYGWRYHRNDAAALEPDLVREYVNIAGADTNALPAPQPEGRPLYQELLIDEDRWASAHRTSHGRLPPVLNKPLPVLPLSPRAIPQKQLPNPKPMQRNLTPHHIMTDIPFSSRQPSQKHGSPEVSPLSQPQPRPASIMSRLSHDIDDEMKAWSETNSLETPINPKWTFPVWEDDERG